MRKLSDTPKNIYTRETNAWRKAHRICKSCGCETAAKGHTMCITCLEKMREYNIHRRKPLSTEQRYTKRIHDNKRYDLLVAFGVCTKCQKHNAIPGHTLCLECNLKQKKRDEKSRRKAGVYPRDSYSDTCVMCGKNPPLSGKKLCSKCYEKAVQNLAKARAAVNLQNHFWRDDDHIAFNRYETEVQQ